MRQPHCKRAASQQEGTGMGMTPPGASAFRFRAEDKDASLWDRDCAGLRERDTRLSKCLGEAGGARWRKIWGNC